MILKVSNLIKIIIQGSLNKYYKQDKYPRKLFPNIFKKIKDFKNVFIFIFNFQSKID